MVKLLSFDLLKCCFWAHKSSNEEIYMDIPEYDHEGSLRLMNAGLQQVCKYNKTNQKSTPWRNKFSEEYLFSQMWLVLIGFLFAR